jgi:hypothetical protein
MIMSPGAGPGRRGISTEMARKSSKIHLQFQFLFATTWLLQESYCMFPEMHSAKRMVSPSFRCLKRSTAAFIPVAGMDKLNENLEKLNENLIALKREVQGPYKEISRSVANGIFLGTVISTIYVSHVLISSMKTSNPHLLTVCMGGAAAAYFVIPTIQEINYACWMKPRIFPLWKTGKRRSQCDAEGLI